MDTSFKTGISSTYKSLIIDFVIILIIFFIPTISHILPFPLYILDPMRILVFITLIFSNNKTNTIIIAMLIPVFSMIFTGHPTFWKSFLISTELLINILIFFSLYQKVKIPLWASVLISIIVSKLIYYCLKYLFINLGLIEGSLISTPLLTQLLTVGILTILAVLMFRKKPSLQ